MLWLVRHPFTMNSADIIQGTDNSIGLSPMGQAQAVAIAQKLKRFSIEKIDSSEILRTKQTTEIINSILKVPEAYDSRLNEYDYGRLTGLSKNALDLDTLMMFLKNPEKFDAEPWDHVFARVGSFLNEQDYSKNTLVVTHSSILYIMMSYLENKNTFDIYSCWEKRQKCDIANGDILRIRNLESEMKILRNAYFCKMKERPKS